MSEHNQDSIWARIEAVPEHRLEGLAARLEALAPANDHPRPGLSGPASASIISIARAIE